MKHLFFLLALLAPCLDVRASDIVPGPPQTKPIALVGGTVYPVSGEPIENGIVIFEDGKITYVGPAEIQLPTGAESIDCAGKRIYPGLFDAASQIGLVEIGAVRATVDRNEAGDVNPNAQSHVSFNPDSELIPVARANGVLLSHVLPGGGLVSGQGAVMQLDGWTYEDMTLAAPTCIRLNWPTMLPRQSWYIQASAQEQIERRDEEMQAIEDLFDQAERYAAALEAARLETAPTSQPASSPTRPEGENGEGKKIPAFDAKLEAMVPLLRGEVPLLVAADESGQIQAAVAFAKRRGLKLTLLGGIDAAKCVDLLKENDVAVILEGTQRLPNGRDDAYDEPFALPATLAEAGVRFAIAANREPAFARNLPYHAAMAVAFGLPEAEALASMTLWPAEILGVADKVGSLEAGKDATLFVADGDILETPTHVTHAWVQGRRLDLSSKHTQLWEKYKQRYGQE
jgi:imidazolonepropionase-like amidohydrolase